MTNDISDTDFEDAVPCFALSKNDSYVMSASGGKISLFNMMTFKVGAFRTHLYLSLASVSFDDDVYLLDIFAFIFLHVKFLFSIVQTMTTFMPPPPAATFLAFHPQDNNIIAIGMEDSSIQIYNVRVDEV